jgi:GTP cyclohydrolase I
MSTEGYVDLERAEKAVRELLLAIGEDPDREGLRLTPHRIANMYAELFSGVREDPGKHLETFFTERYDEMVIVRDISFHSVCEHHFMPFIGTAHVAYMPDGRVVGVSKLARVIETFSHRPQVQERLTTQIADLIMSKLQPKGVAVVLMAEHTCMTIRGVKKPGSRMITSALRGIFKTNLATRNEFMSFFQNGR